MEESPTCGEMPTAAKTNTLFAVHHGEGWKSPGPVRAV